MSQEVRRACLPALGETAPDFSAVTTFGPLRFSDYRGKWVIFSLTRERLRRSARPSFWRLPIFTRNSKPEYRSCRPEYRHQCQQSGVGP
jgi:hypothetical protein